MHGAQSGLCLMISALGAYGRVVSGFVGPKTTSVGVPTAEPMCAGPVSLVIRTSATLIIAVASATLVLPVRTIGFFVVCSETSFETSISAGDPIKATLAPALAK